MNRGLRILVEARRPGATGMTLEDKPWMAADRRLADSDL
jgi:hypothetical protein